MNSKSFLILAMAVAACLPHKVQAVTGDLLEADFASGAIFRYTPGGVKTTFSSGAIGGPVGVAFDGKGNLYATDRASDTIVKITPAGVKTTFATGFPTGAGLAFDGAGNLFAAEFNSGIIYKITPSGTKTTFATDCGFPSGLVFDAAGTLFQTDQQADVIYKYNTAGTRSLFGNSALSNPAGCIFDPSGNLIVADSGSGNVFRYASNGSRSTYTSGISVPIGLALDGAGNLFVAANGNGTIVLVTPGGIKSNFASGLSNPNFLVFEPKPHTLLNISTRAFVQTGNKVLFAGFIVGGNGEVNDAVIIRAIGPSLGAIGVEEPLQDPTLDLVNASGVILATNDNWRTSQQSLIIGTGVPPTDDRESAIYATLPAGNYTAIVRGVGGITGNAVVEVYNLQ